MITDIRRWPGRVLLTLGSCYAGIQIIVYQAFVLTFSPGDHYTPPPPGSDVSNEGFYFELTFYGSISGLVLLCLVLPLLWPRIFIWPVLGMLGIVLGFHLLMARNAWSDPEYGSGYIFTEPLFILMLAIPAVLLALLIPAARRLLRRKRLPPPEHPPAQNDPE